MNRRQLFKKLAGIAGAMVAAPVMAKAVVEKTSGNTLAKFALPTGNWQLKSDAVTSSSVLYNRVEGLRTFTAPMKESLISCQDELKDIVADFSGVTLKTEHPSTFRLEE